LAAITQIKFAQVEAAGAQRST
ncbi:MAG: hypothetical protein RLY92_742, partial [Chloroflexota bacterium]